MPAKLSARLSLTIGALVGSAVLWMLLARTEPVEGAQDPDEKLDLTKAEFWGVSSCMKCHRAPSEGYNTDLAALNEYAIWRSKDRHALAYAVLAGPRGQQMGKLLGINVTDVVEGAACLNCHATTFRPDRRGQDFSLADGVSCDGCHGPAQHWFNEHAFKQKFWRSLTPEQKEARGMYNLRDPIRRAEMCMSCHVGNAAEGKVVTHEMYAAGHPPLPAFEVAGFSDNLPKHWMDLKDTPFFKKADPKIQKAYHFDSAEFQQTRLVLASSTIAVRAMMDLVANRATLTAAAPAPQGPRNWPPPWLIPHSKNEVKDRWPELPKKIDAGLTEALSSRWPEIAMAQTDCYACHHDLKSKSWRQIRGYQGKPGRPHLQPWPFALLKLSSFTAAEQSDFAARRKQLHAACDAQPFGIPDAIAKAAGGLAASSALAGSSAKPLDRSTVSQLLKKLTTFNEDEYPDYPSACQITWAFRMIYGDLVPAKSQPNEVKDILNALDDELGLTIESPARKKFVAARYELTKKLIATNDAAEIEKTLKDPNFLEPLQAVSNQELAAILERMAQYDPVQFKQKMQQLGQLAP